jgi:hypothetical protein
MTIKYLKIIHGLGDSARNEGSWERMYAFLVVIRRCL